MQYETLKTWFLDQAKKVGMDISGAFKQGNGLMKTYDELDRKSEEFSMAWENAILSIGIPKSTWMHLQNASKGDKVAFADLIDDDELSRESLEGFSQLGFPESELALKIAEKKRIVELLKSFEKDSGRAKILARKALEQIPDTEFEWLIKNELAVEECQKLLDHRASLKGEKVEALTTQNSTKAEVEEVTPPSQPEAVKMLVAQTPQKPQETQLEVVVEKPNPEPIALKEQKARQAKSAPAVDWSGIYGSPTDVVAPPAPPVAKELAPEAPSKEEAQSSLLDEDEVVDADWEYLRPGDSEETPPVIDVEDEEDDLIFSEEERLAFRLDQVRRGGSQCLERIAGDDDVKDEHLISFVKSQRVDGSLQSIASTILYLRQIRRESEARKAERHSKYEEMPILDEDAPVRDEWREVEAKPNFLQKYSKELIAFVAILVLASFGGFVLTSFRDLFLGESGSLLPALFSGLLIVFTLNAVRLCAESRSWVSEKKANTLIKRGVTLSLVGLLLLFFSGYVINWLNQPVIVATNTDSDEVETPEEVVETPQPQVVEALPSDPELEGWPWQSELLRKFDELMLDPKKRLSAEELAAITDYSEDGGRAFYYWAKKTLKKGDEYILVAWEWKKLREKAPEYFRGFGIRRPTTDEVSKAQEALIEKTPEEDLDLIAGINLIIRLQK